MEQLLHYVWKHKLFPLTALCTTSGKPVEVIDPGLHNRNAGPDFFNAKIRLDGTLWVGNVEIHERSADWFLHGHDTDAAYNNVVLHVAAVVDADVVTERGDRLPQVQLAVPQQVLSNYRRLLAFDRYPPCREAVLPLDAIKKRSWLSALVAERLNEKTEAIRRRVALFEGSWEAAFFATMARSFGFGVNSEAFEQWAERLPLMQIAHHRDNPFQVEAMFMGMAGLLDETQMTPQTREAALADDYFLSLKREFGYLSRNPYRSVCTLSTHDMPTLRQWWDEDIQRTQEYYNTMLYRQGPAPHPLPGWLAQDIISRHLTSPSMLCILSIQDWLAINEHLRLPDANAERINIPANPKHYWRYRMHLSIEDLAANKEFMDSVTELVAQSGRN